MHTLLNYLIRSLLVSGLLLGYYELLMSGVATRSTAGQLFSPASAIATLAAAVSLWLLLLLAIRVRALYRLRRRCGAERMENYLLIRVEDRRAPFSFFNNLFWQHGAAISTPLNVSFIHP